MVRDQGEGALHLVCPPHTYPLESRRKPFTAILQNNKITAAPALLLLGYSVSPFTRNLPVITAPVHRCTVSCSSL